MLGYFPFTVTVMIIKVGMAKSFVINNEIAVFKFCC